MLIRPPILGDHHQIGVDMGGEEPLLRAPPACPSRGTRAVPAAPTTPLVPARSAGDEPLWRPRPPASAGTAVTWCGDGADPDLVGSPLPDRGEERYLLGAVSDRTSPLARAGPGPSWSRRTRRARSDPVPPCHRASRPRPMPGRPDPRPGRWRPSSSQNSGVVCDALTWRATAMRCSSSWIRSVAPNQAFSGPILPSRRSSSA